MSEWRKDSCWLSQHGTSSESKSCCCWLVNCIKLPLTDAMYCRQEGVFFGGWTYLSGWWYEPVVSEGGVAGGEMLSDTHRSITNYTSIEEWKENINNDCWGKKHCPQAGEVSDTRVKGHCKVNGSIKQDYAHFYHPIESMVSLFPSLMIRSHTQNRKHPYKVTIPTFTFPSFFTILLLLENPFPFFIIDISFLLLAWRHNSIKVIYPTPTVSVIITKGRNLSHYQHILRCSVDRDLHGSKWR